MNLILTNILFLRSTASFSSPSSTNPLFLSTATKSPTSVSSLSPSTPSTSASSVSSVFSCPAFPSSFFLPNLRFLFPTLCSTTPLVCFRPNRLLISLTHSSPLHLNTLHASSTKSVQFVPMSARQNTATSTLPSTNGKAEISATCTNSDARKSKLKILNPIFFTLVANSFAIRASPHPKSAIVHTPCVRGSGFGDPGTLVPSPPSAPFCLHSLPFLFFTFR